MDKLSTGPPPLCTELSANDTFDKCQPALLPSDGTLCWSVVRVCSAPVGMASQGAILPCCFVQEGMTTVAFHIRNGGSKLRSGAASAQGALLGVKRQRSWYWAGTADHRAPHPVCPWCAKGVSAHHHIPLAASWPCASSPHAWATHRAKHGAQHLRPRCRPHQEEEILDPGLLGLRTLQSYQGVTRANACLIRGGRVISSPNSRGSMLMGKARSLIHTNTSSRAISTQETEVQTRLDILQYKFHHSWILGTPEQ